MIVTVTLNAALDTTYRVSRLRPARSHRVLESASRAGGKGVNVARVLHALGQPTVVTGLAGGDAGRAIRRDLAASGLVDELVDVGGETRRTVAVVDSQAGATVLLEPGPVVGREEWERFLARFDALIGTSDAVVVSGSAPPGVPSDAYATLTAIASARGLPVVLDAEGPALLAGLRGRPALVKPNADELYATTGDADVLTAAERLRAQGAESVVASLGADGMLACTPHGRWLARPPGEVAGNPTGAGDAAVAALTVGLLAGDPWPARLTQAVALSAAAVAAPLAGEFDPAVHRDLLHRVEVEALPWNGASTCP